MANKPRVLPSALHSELTEYSSLLRTLRTNNILDVSLHLTQSGRDVNNLVSDEEQMPSRDSTSQEQITDAAYNGNVTNRKREREYHGQKRDNWTRWPLLLKDVFKPTWNFEDEVAIIASQALKLNSILTSLPSSQGSCPNDDPQTCPPERTEQLNNDASEDDDLGVDDPDVPSYYKYIAMSTYDFLLNILALIASHPPPRPPSMQNRIEPLNWRSVLEIVSVYGDYSVIDEQILNQIQARMEALYGLPDKSSFPEFENGESSVAFRLRKKNKVERQLDSAMSQAFESLFEFPPPNFIEPPKPKRPKKARTKKEENVEFASTFSSKDKKGKARSKNAKKEKELETEKGEDSRQVESHMSCKGVWKANGTVRAKNRMRTKNKDRDEATSPKTRKNFKSRAIISDSSDEGETPTKMDMDDMQVRTKQPQLIKEAEDVNTTGDVNPEEDLGQEAPVKAQAWE